jgi:hypothetical protein
MLAVTVLSVIFAVGVISASVRLRHHQSPADLDCAPPDASGPAGSIPYRFVHHTS